MAKKVFSIPATSAPSERDFSSAGLFDSALRSSLGSEKLAKMIVIDRYCKSPFYKPDRLIDAVLAMYEAHKVKEHVAAQGSQ